MILARPGPAEERWLALGARLRPDGTEALLAARGGGWKRTSLVLRCALFLMGAVAASLTLSICHLLHLSHAPGAAGAVLLALAELLIIRRRLFASGVEEALELAGLLLLFYEFLLPQLRTLLHGSDAFGLTAMAWTFFAAFAVAGLRLLNPLLTTLAAVLMVLAITITAAPSWESAAWDLQASLLCYGLAVAALAAGGKLLQRPAYERMLDWLVVAMPVAGYLCVTGHPIIRIRGQAKVLTFFEARRDDDVGRYQYWGDHGFRVSRALGGTYGSGRTLGRDSAAVFSGAARSFEDRADAGAGSQDGAPLPASEQLAAVSARGLG